MTHRAPWQLLFVAILFTEGASAQERTDRTRDTPPPMYVVNGVALSGGFEVFLSDPSALGVDRIRIVRPPEAEPRWGPDAASGAVLLTLEGGPEAGASLREVVAHHSRFLAALAERDPRPAPARIPHLADETFPPWARVLVVVDGEILPRPRTPPGGWPEDPSSSDPPPSWLEALEGHPHAQAVIRAYRGESAAQRYGNVAWFGVVEITTTH